MLKEDIVVSGTRPTGNLHLGNYLGAVKQFVELQDMYKCYFFIADIHSLTTHPNPKDLHRNVKTVLVEYLASGLDPDKITLYLQSDLPQTSELYLFMNMHAYVGELERVPTFKEKVRTQPDNVNAGLLTYPVLMAADILIHKANRVPVGKDQEQHLELTRVFARRFNNLYGQEIFPETQAYGGNGKLIKIPSLDGTGKMSKSDNIDSCIFLRDSESELLRKIKKAKTDTGPEGEDMPISEPVQNILNLMEYTGNLEGVAFYKEAYRKANIRYGDLKKQLAEDMNLFLKPIRDKILDLESDDKYLGKVVKEGAEKAHISADNTLNELKEIIGFKKFYPVN